jgi:hypothetical protein
MLSREIGVSIDSKSAHNSHIEAASSLLELGISDSGGPMLSREIGVSTDRKSAHKSPNRGYWS